MRGGEGEGGGGGTLAVRIPTPHANPMRRYVRALKSGRRPGKSPPYGGGGGDDSSGYAGEGYDAGAGGRDGTGDSSGYDSPVHAFDKRKDVPNPAQSASAAARSAGAGGGGGGGGGGGARRPIQARITAASRPPSRADLAALGRELLTQSMEKRQMREHLLGPSGGGAASNSGAYRDPSWDYAQDGSW